MQMSKARTSAAKTAAKARSSLLTSIPDEELLLEDDFRLLARTEYRYYRRYMSPKFHEGPHNLLLAEKLQQIELRIRTKGKEGIGRLGVCMPPQYGKTLDIARLFASYVIGRNPDAHIAIISYGADLADKHSAAVRDYVQSQEFNNLFGERSALQDPVMLSDDSASKSDWKLAAPYEGGCISRGLGGGLSGNPVDLLIIDDPTKDIDDARSESHQQKLENWFDSVGLQRLSEYGCIIVVHTRWDPNDLIGQLLKRMASGDPNVDQYEFVFLPALALEAEEYPKTMQEYLENLANGIYIPMGGDQLGRKPGQALWPWRYSQKYVEAKKANAKSPYIFASVDQQLPRPFSGGMFDAKNIKEVESSIIDPEWTWVSYIDVALGRNKRSDFNVACIETISPVSGDVIVRDMLRERELHSFLKLLKLCMKKPENKKVLWGIEDVAFQTEAFQNFWTDPTLAMVAIVKFPVPEGSKQDRAANLSLRAKEGHLSIVKNTVWNPPFKKQLMSYPFDTHDDIVDSASGGLYIMAKYANREKKKAGSHQG
jgi:phage terminase large subunit-like protein